MTSPTLPLVVAPAGPPEAVAAVARQAATELGLPSPSPLRLGMNGVYGAGENVVLRVARTTADPSSGPRLARLLLDQGVRVPRPIADGAVVTDGELSVTVWERIAPDPAVVVDWTEVGTMVARVHTLDRSAVEARHPLPWCGDFPWWRFAALHDEVAALGVLTDDELAALDTVRRRHGGWEAAARRVPLGVCHGDVHPGNVLVGAEGPVLLDWDLCCLGPAAWDHAPLLTWTSRWGGEPGIYEAFARGIGADLRDDRVADALAELRLLAATLMMARRGASDPARAEEAHRRMRWWLGDPEAPQWRAF